MNRIFTLQLDVEETGRVQGYIRNFLGEPLSGITVTASRLGYPSISNITDSSGFYSFDLPAGNYIFTTSSPSHITVSKATTVAPNLIIPVDFELHLKTPFMVGCSMRTLTGTPHLWKGLLWNF